MISACAQGCFFLSLFLCPLEFVLKACVTDVSKLGYIQSIRVIVFFSFFANKAKNIFFTTFWRKYSKTLEKKDISFKFWPLTVF